MGERSGLLRSWASDRQDKPTMTVAGAMKDERPPACTITQILLERASKAWTTSSPGSTQRALKQLRGDEPRQQVETALE